MTYFDSTYIAKFYVDEPESDAVRRLAESLGQVGCAAIGQVEVASAFHRKFREGTFDARAFRAVMAQFDDDCRAGLWTWLPLTDALAARATAAFAGVPRPLFLRAADALHLVCPGAWSRRDLYERPPHVGGGPALSLEADHRRSAVDRAGEVVCPRPRTTR